MVLKRFISFSDFDWFVYLNNVDYVNTHKLVKTLNKINFSKPICLTWPGTNKREEIVLQDAENRHKVNIASSSLFCQIFRCDDEVTIFLISIFGG